MYLISRGMSPIKVLGAPSFFSVFSVMAVHVSGEAMVA